MCVFIRVSLVIDRVHGASLRARAGGDVIAPDRTVSSLDLAMQYSAPSNLVLTPAPECESYVHCNKNPFGLSVLCIVKWIWNTG